MALLEKLRDNDGFYKTIKATSEEREKFIQEMVKNVPGDRYIPPEDLAHIEWEIPFRANLMPAAGIYKGLEGYNLELALGAAAYQIGSMTWNENPGIEIAGIESPFTWLSPYSSINNISLKNSGRRAVEEIADIDPIEGFPIIVTIADDKRDSEEDRIANVIKFLKLCEKIPAIKAVQYSRSPNIAGFPTEQYLIQREKDIDRIRAEFLEERSRNLPFLEKIPSDSPQSSLYRMMDYAFKKGVDGWTIGNSTKDYNGLRQSIVEQGLYNYFTENFQGSISGALIAGKVLGLIDRAQSYLDAGQPTQEFHIIRSGGVRSPSDLKSTVLSEWNNARIIKHKIQGNNLYRNMYRDNNAA